MNEPQGLLECKHCLVVAAVMAAVFGLAAWLGIALAGPGVAFTLCSNKTCGAAPKEVSDKIGFAGEIIIQPDIIRSVSGMAGCPQCSVVTFEKGTAQVIGKPLDVACKLFGGELCKTTP
jgi:hypothetical protein